jgi:hypothetical protein
MDRMPFVIYKLTSSSLCAITSSIYLSSHQEPSWGARQLRSALRESGPAPSILLPSIRLITILSGLVEGCYRATKSSSFPKEQVFLKVSTPATPQVVACGTVFILFPGVWHRYAPDSAVGWTEHWLECQGPAFGEALRTGIVQPTQPSLHKGSSLTSYAALSAATHSRLGAHWRTRTSYRRWVFTFSR